MATYILGVSAFFHDAAAVLLRDGEIVAAAQEERFTRVKGDPRFPAAAVAYCLREAGITAGDLDHVAVQDKPLARFERLLETALAFAPAGFGAFRRAALGWGRKLRLDRTVREALGERFDGTLLFANHHEAHAASAFFPSPFEEAAILTLDAVGEWDTSTIGVGSGSALRLTHEMRFPHSLGMLYSAITHYAGFKVNSGEYKLMGLAPYGEPRYADRILGTLAVVHDDGSLWLDMSYFDYCHGDTMTSEKFHRLFDGPPRRPESWIGRKEMDLAASIQVVCEEVVLRAARHAHRLTGQRHLVMAGGVALNCVANGRLRREGPFEALWIQPAAGDAGGALGAALLAWHHVLQAPRTPTAPDALQGALLGPAFERDDIDVYLESVGAVSEAYDDEDALLERVVDLLVDDQVVGWFHGRMEFGPRALGARSILGDPRSSTLQADLNVKIKFRESFRPFAPCILGEHVHEVVEMPPGEDSPYMLLTAAVRPELRTMLSEADRARLRDPDLRVRVSVPRSTIPAVTHVDYSARVQTVDPGRHGRFYRLLRRFHARTGCPVLVNTSFNIRGEPIVCTPEDAWRCFMATEMDVLVIENRVLLKREQPAAAAAERREAYRAQYALD
jgi:carbamoyltransferase